ncbi:MAG: ferritin-like domain-containing protein, partial [Acidimicrobiia bacterium]
MSFDLDHYKRVVARLDHTDLDLAGAFRARPLPPELLRCVRYMHDVEHHTTCYLRNLLNTRAHHDPDVTAFLTLWNYEEHWHGEALAEILRAHGEPAGAPRVAAMRRRLGARLTASPVLWMAFSSVSRHFLAVHMTFGVVNEWTTQAAYSRLIALAGHDTMSELLRRIMRQEGRHIDY